MNILKYFFKPYTLVVQCFGCIVSMEVIDNVVHGHEVMVEQPVLMVFRFWSKRGLHCFVKTNDVCSLKLEQGKTFSGCYYQN